MDVANLFFLIAPLVLLLVRLIYLIFKCHRQRASAYNFGPAKMKTISMLAVAGSGGHTKELLSLMNVLGPAFTPRYYVVSETDQFSLKKIHEIEFATTGNGCDYYIRGIPRSREVHQSYLSSIVSTIVAFIKSFPVVMAIRPDVVLCNGPGTCIPICFWAFVLKLFFIKDTKIIYVESICRVRTLSLSGRLLYHFVDYFIVQWKELADRFAWSLYIGKLL